MDSGDGARVKAEIVQRLLTRLDRTAVRHACARTDLAATFLAVAVDATSFIAVHVGDGVIGYVKHGELKVVSGPDNDEFANTTTFVSSESTAASMRLLRGSLEGVSGFVLMSDGAADSLFNHQTSRLAPACAKMIALTARAPHARAKDPRYKKQLRTLLDTRIRDATRDDCSIGVFGRRLPGDVDS